MGNIMKQHSILFTLFIPFTVLFILAFAIFMSYFIITESDKAKTDSFIYRDSCPDAPFVNKSHESYRIRGSFFIAHDSDTATIPDCCQSFLIWKLSSK